MFDKVTDKTYPETLVERPEALRTLTFHWTPDKKPCEIVIETSMDRRYTICPGTCADFIEAWCDAVRFGTDKEAAQRTWDRVPDVSPEERAQLEVESG
jgi:hypothetical protein